MNKNRIKHYNFYCYAQRATRIEIIQNISLFFTRNSYKRKTNSFGFITAKLMVLFCFLNIHFNFGVILLFRENLFVCFTIVQLLKYTYILLLLFTSQFMSFLLLALNLTEIMNICSSSINILKTDTGITNEKYLLSKLHTSNVFIYFLQQQDLYFLVV